MFRAKFDSRFTYSGCFSIICFYDLVCFIGQIWKISFFNCIMWCFESTRNVCNLFFIITYPNPSNVSVEALNRLLKRQIHGNRNRHFKNATITAGEIRHHKIIFFFFSQKCHQRWRGRERAEMILSNLEIVI